jgi:S1-C subfamily serine protease
VAVLQLSNASGLKTVTTADSSKLSVGEDIVGIGNAGGTGGTPSAAGGTVTALNQSITASDEEDGASEQLTGLVETNADIQPGDSGGSLVNSSGQVVGMDTAASAGFSFQPNQSSGATQAYAIPINKALSIARSIEAGTGSSTVHIGATAFLGITAASGSCQGSGIGSIFGNGSGLGNGSGSTSSGVTICTVITSSPAQEAGLVAGDVITTVNGQAVTSISDLTNTLEPDHPGDSVALGWTDASGQTHTATVQLSSGPPQ